MMIYFSLYSDLPQISGVRQPRTGVGRRSIEKVQENGFSAGVGIGRHKKTRRGGRVLFSD
jgi:hypothetical protein